MAAPTRHHHLRAGVVYAAHGRWHDTGRLDASGRDVRRLARRSSASLECGRQSGGTAVTQERPVDAMANEFRALPSGYIDPEHKGEDLALLETFYRACLAEGGTVDEITLRGIRAVLATHSTPQPEPEPVAVSERPWERDDWCDALGKVFRQGQ